MTLRHAPLSRTKQDLEIVEGTFRWVFHRIYGLKWKIWLNIMWCSGRTCPVSRILALGSSSCCRPLSRNLSPENKHTHYTSHDMPIVISDTQSQVLVVTWATLSPWRMFWALWHEQHWTLSWRLGPWLSSSLGPRSHGRSQSWCWTLERTAGLGTSAQISLSHSLLKRTLVNMRDLEKKFNIPFFFFLLNLCLLGTWLVSCRVSLCVLQ